MCKVVAIIVAYEPAVVHRREKGKLEQKLSATEKSARTHLGIFSSMIFMIKFEYSNTSVDGLGAVVPNSPSNNGLMQGEGCYIILEGAWIHSQANKHFTWVRFQHPSNICI